MTLSVIRHDSEGNGTAMVTVQTLTNRCTAQVRKYDAGKSSKLR